jgi:apolipoprotein N-acyltransferase
MYRKVRLVPFGEYVPFKQLLFFVGPLIEAVSDFTPGDDLTVFETEGSRFSVAICYEGCLRRDGADIREPRVATPDDHYQ